MGAQTHKSCDWEPRPEQFSHSAQPSDYLLVRSGKIIMTADRTWAPLGAWYGLRRRLIGTIALEPAYHMRTVNLGNHVCYVRS